MLLTYILIGVGLLIAGFIVLVSMQPADFRVGRTAKMSASPSTVFAQVNDFHNWPAWSPWEKLDPNMKRTHEGASSGAGAVYSWTGNNKVGEGRMTMTDSQPNEMIRIKLEFIRPFKSTNTTEFTFKPEGNQTLVTWNMLGHKSFMMKAFCMFMNMDKLVGGDFEKGLGNLKGVVEGKSAPASTTT